MRPPTSVVAAGLALGISLAAPVGALAQEGHDPGAGAHGAGASAQRVAIGFASFAPSAVEVVVGDAVAFVNESARTHTVTADDGSFDSGRMPAGATFTRSFSDPGRHAYFCALHPGMRGEVRVARLLLQVPEAPAAPGRAYPISGRAALAPGSVVTIADDAGQELATAAVRRDGGFAASIVPRRSTGLVARSGEITARPVQLVVRDRRIAATVRRHHGRSRIAVRVSPAAPGETVVLQMRLPLRFGWWPVHRARLDRRSTARFTGPRRRLAVRVALTLPDGATVLATTPVLRLHHRGRALRRSGR